MIQTGLVLLAISAIAALFYLPWPFVLMLLAGAALVGVPIVLQDRRNEKFMTRRDRRRQAQG